MLREFRQILRRTGGGKRFALLLLLRAPFDFAFTAIQATFLQRAFDAIARADGAGLNRACLAFCLASLCLFVYNGSVWSVYAPFVIRLEGKLRRGLYRKLASLSLLQAEARSAGEWMTRLGVDVELPFSRPLHLPHAACALVNICASAALLWRANPAVLIWVMLFTLPHIAVSQRLVARAMPALQQKALEAMARNTGDMEALTTRADVAALYDGWAFLMARFEASSRALLRANMALRAREALSAGLLPLLGLGGYLTLLFVCGGWIAAGDMTFGDLTAAFQYRGGVLIGALMLIRCSASIRASLAGIRRMEETMEERSEEDDG